MLGEDVVADQEASVALGVLAPMGRAIPQARAGLFQRAGPGLEGVTDRGAHVGEGLAHDVQREAFVRAFTRGIGRQLARDEA